MSALIHNHKLLIKLNRLENEGTTIIAHRKWSGPHWMAGMASEKCKEIEVNSWLALWPCGNCPGLIHWLQFEQLAGRNRLTEPWAMYQTPPAPTFSISVSTSDPSAGHLAPSFSGFHALLFPLSFPFFFFLGRTMAFGLWQQRTAAVLAFASSPHTHDSCVCHVQSHKSFIWKLLLYCGLIACDHHHQQQPHELYLVGSGTVLDCLVRHKLHVVFIANCLASPRPASPCRSHRYI